MECSEEALKAELEKIKNQLGKKTQFEEALFSLRSLLSHRYSSSSPPLQKSFYDVVCRVATVLRTRYTAAGFWVGGLGLFQEAERLSSNCSEKEQLKDFIAQANQHLHQTHNADTRNSHSSSTPGYLFEGHLTVDPEPPQPQWLVQSNLLSSMASVLEAQSTSHSTNNDTTAESAANLLEQLITQLDEVIPEIMGDGPGVPRAPPASKEVVAKLPVITATEEILAKLGKDAECAICKENLVVDDKMQELPCKHTFHPPCLKPWLDEHNSCPICRHELHTDDHVYESWKEREKEAEEERKGAANAVRGGEFMYL